MRTTLLGHASVLVEMGPGGSVRCLMDPVFVDPFEDGAVVSCPRRSIALSEIPPVDLLVISHAHLDHFDIPSLAHVAKKSRKCDVLCPKDPPIVYALERLGFTKIHPEGPMTHLAFPKYELLTTPSAVSNVIEMGVVFKDRSGVFWNQVDTIIPPSAVEPTIRQTGPIDLLFAMYASQNFKFFESKGASFPHRTHEMNLSNVIAINPRFAVPGSAGFRFAGDGMEWCNPFLFPMARERFVADLARVAPSIPTAIANPGDVFEIRDGRVEHRRGASRIAIVTEDDTARLRFDPTAPVPPLRDPNPAQRSRKELETIVETCLTELSTFVRETRGDAVLDAYHEHRAVYAIGVVFPDERERWMRIAFDEGEPRITWSDEAVSADAGHRIVASALAAWTTHEKSYFYLRAFSRKWSHVYALREEGGRAVVEPRDIEDLLAYYLQRKARGASVAFKEWLDLQLAPFISR